MLQLNILIHGYSEVANKLQSGDELKVQFFFSACGTIDNTLPYGYETNYVSALISIKSSSSILVSRTKKTFAGLWLYAMMNAYKCYRLLIRVVLWIIW